jgi:MFS transporter, AAHS family, 4-hydroxybenzoate transporter
MADANLQRQSPMPFERMSSLQFKVVVLCFLAILFDGIDTTAIGVVVPTLARSWPFRPPALRRPSSPPM